MMVPYLRHESRASLESKPRAKPTSLRPKCTLRKKAFKFWSTGHRTSGGLALALGGPEFRIDKVIRLHPERKNCNTLSTRSTQQEVRRPLLLTGADLFRIIRWRNRVSRST